MRFKECFYILDILTKIFSVLHKENYAFFNERKTKIDNAVTRIADFTKNGAPFLCNFIFSNISCRVSGIV